MLSKNMLCNIFWSIPYCWMCQWDTCMELVWHYQSSKWKHSEACVENWNSFISVSSYWIIKNKTGFVVFNYRLSTSERKYSATEVNSLKIGSVTDIAGDILFAGCGDNNIYSFSLEDGRVLRTYSEHLDYIHNIDVRYWTKRCCKA